MTSLALSALLRPVATRLPPEVEVRWFETREQALAIAPDVEIGWFDMYDKAAMGEVIAAATNLRWLNSIYAGVEHFPLDLLRARNTIVTNGAGINALTIAEYVVMGMLTVAKGYRDVVRAQDRREWLSDSPGKAELAESRALILGGGAIGSLVATRLAAFGVTTTIVRRTPGVGELGPDAWHERLGEFDWVILAVPATPETERMIGAAELAAMKPGAVLVNVARGSVVDTDALVAALQQRRIGSAFLDVTDPEPLPADHPLWMIDTAHVTMHLSGQAQDKMFPRAIERFVDNLGRYLRGEPLTHRVDLTLGY